MASNMHPTMQRRVGCKGERAMKRIPTRAHGILDYGTAAACLALPRRTGWTPEAAWLMTGGGLFALGYSLLTRYELGLVRVLPMQAHLALDVAFGAYFIVGVIRSPDESRAFRRAALVLAAIGLTAPLITETE